MNVVFEFVNVLGLPENGSVQQYPGPAYIYCACLRIVGAALNGDTYVHFHVDSEYNPDEVCKDLGDSIPKNKPSNTVRVCVSGGYTTNTYDLKLQKWADAIRKTVAVKSVRFKCINVVRRTARRRSIKYDSKEHDQSAGDLSVENIVCPWETFRKLSQDLENGVNLVFPESQISIRYLTCQEAIRPMLKAADTTTMLQLYATMKKYKLNMDSNVTVWPLYSSIGGNFERVRNAVFFCDADVILQRTAPRESGSRSRSVHPRSMTDGRRGRSRSVHPKLRDDVRGRSRSVHPKLRDDVRGRSWSVHPRPSVSDDRRGRSHSVRPRSDDCDGRSRSRSVHPRSTGNDGRDDRECGRRSRSRSTARPPKRFYPSESKIIRISRQQIERSRNKMTHSPEYKICRRDSSDGGSGRRAGERGRPVSRSYRIRLTKGGHDRDTPARSQSRAGRSTGGRSQSRDDRRDRITTDRESQLDKAKQIKSNRLKSVVCTPQKKPTSKSEDSDDSESSSRSSSSSSSSSSERDNSENETESDAAEAAVVEESQVLDTSTTPGEEDYDYLDDIHDQFKHTDAHINRVDMEIDLESFLD